jgi:hypothetical protein
MEIMLKAPRIMTKAPRIMLEPVRIDKMPFDHLRQLWLSIKKTQR